MVAASLDPEAAKMCCSRVYTQWSTSVNILQVLLTRSKRIILTWQNKARKNCCFCVLVNQNDLFHCQRHQSLLFSKQHCCLRGFNAKCDVAVRCHGERESNQMWTCLNGSKERRASKSPLSRFEPTEAVIKITTRRLQTAANTVKAITAIHGEESQRG